VSDDRPRISAHPALASLSPTLIHGNTHATAEALVARALAPLPGFSRWSHQPTTPEIERLLLDLDEQQLMNTAAVCLLRLMQKQQPPPQPSTDAA